MTDKSKTMKNETTLSIEDIERVVSTIVKQHAQVQRDQILSIVTDIDKEKTQFLLAMNDLKESLLDKVKQEQKDAKADYATEIQALETSVKENIQEIKNTIKDVKEQQFRRDTSCQHDHEKQLERVVQNQKELETKIFATLDKQKPNYYAMIPLIVLLTSPFIKWFFEIHAEMIQTKAVMSVLQSQQELILKQQDEILGKIKIINSDNSKSRAGLIATGTLPPGD